MGGVISFMIFFFEGEPRMLGSWDSWVICLREIQKKKKPSQIGNFFMIGGGPRTHLERDKTMVILGGIGGGFFLETLALGFSFKWIWAIF